MSSEGEVFVPSRFARPGQHHPSLVSGRPRPAPGPAIFEHGDEGRGNWIAAAAAAFLGVATAVRRSSYGGSPSRRRTNLGSRLLEKRHAVVSEASRATKTLQTSALVLPTLYMFSLVLNKFSFRLVLAPMAPYTHLLAVMTNVVYVALFTCLCRIQESNGNITQEAWDFVLRGTGRKLLIGAGLAEATTFVAMPLFASRLPGSMMPVLSQTMIPFSMLLSAVTIGKRYDRLQCLGVFVVILGVGVCSIPKFAAASGGALMQGGTLAFTKNALGLLTSYFFFACALVFKQAVFARYGSGQHDVRLSGNLVNLVASLWQGLGLWLLWPANFMLVSHMSPASYFSSALSSCLLPLSMALLLIYWVANVNFTIVSIYAISRLSATVVLLAGAFGVPITALLFCFKWPMLAAEPFSWYFMGGLSVIMLGLLVYNHKTLLNRT